MKTTLTSLLMAALFLVGCQKDNKQTVRGGTGNAGASSADSTASWDGMSHRGNSKYSVTSTP